MTLACSHQFFERDRSLFTRILKAIAGQQWAAATYLVGIRAFELTKERDRIAQVACGVERADGNDYCLTRDTDSQMLTAMTKLG